MNPGIPTLEAHILHRYITHPLEIGPYSLSVLSQFALGLFLSNNIKENISTSVQGIILRKINLMMKHTKLVTFWKAMIQIRIKLKIKVQGTFTNKRTLKVW